MCGTFRYCGCDEPEWHPLTSFLRHVNDTWTKHCNCHDLDVRLADLKQVQAITSDLCNYYNCAKTSPSPCPLCILMMILTFLMECCTDVGRKCP